MPLITSLVGYDKASEKLAVEFDMEKVGCVPLPPKIAQEIAKAMGVEIDTSKNDFFLEVSERV